MICKALIIPVSDLILKLKYSFDRFIFMHKRSWVIFMCTAGNGWSDHISHSTVGSCCDFGIGSVCRVLSRLDVRKRAGKPLSPLMCACTIVPPVCPHAAEALLIREAFQRYPARCPDREEVQLGFDFLGQSTRVIVWGRDFQGLEFRDNGLEWAFRKVNIFYFAL